MAGQFVAGGRALAPGRGWDWIAQAWALFKKQPGVWIGLVVILVIVFIVMALIPLIGSLATIVLGPVFMGGIALGTRAQDTGGELAIGHLFAGFQERFGPLVLVGVLYLVASVAIALVVGLLMGASLFSLMSGTVPDTMPAGAILTLLLAALIGLALMVPVFMAIWFAPALVVFDGKDAIEAMKQSFAGCLKNIVPFLIYGLVLFVLSILASIPLGLGWLLLGPVLAASVYTGYKDIFTAA